MEKFDLSQIKAGYLLVVQSRKTYEQFRMTVSVGITSEAKDTGLVCCCPGMQWWPLEAFGEEGSAVKEYEVVAVYGYTVPRFTLDNRIDGRELLWKRKEPWKMTLAEICKNLGYDVAIVKEGEA